MIPDVKQCSIGVPIVITNKKINVILLDKVLSLYLDKRRGVQKNTSMRLREC